MKKAKYNEVPKEYRRNYGKEAMGALEMIAGGMLFGVIILSLLLIAILT